ncbi:helix-turn-helix domain-containing protein [Vibrio chagasii]|nr:helix-turn-helix domain-containing protein [Vibrio chagasii]
MDWQDASGLQQIVEGSDVATPDIKPIAEANPINKNRFQAVKVWGMSLEIKSMIILETLIACNGRRKDMAEKLGISPRTQAIS